MNSPDGFTRYSLWHDLIDGSVSIWVCVLINLALGVFLTGAALLMSVFLPELYWWVYGLRPTDELMTGVFVLCGLAFVGGTVWIWSRKSRRRALLRPTLWSMGIGAVTTVLCVVASDTFRRGGEEIIVIGLIFLAGGWVMLIWTNASYQMSRGRPMQNEQDGLPDIRCPKCGYRMVGLREARCPECGESYTLDELLGRQDFSWPARGAEPVQEANRAG